MEKVSFVNKVSSVMKATSNDETPIPGYLYPEIAKISWENDLICEGLLEFLLERLDKDSCNVKLKVLKLMKYVVENGHPKFAMGLRKHSRGIKEATGYGGKPDPLHGNIPYILVRKAAKELSETLFDTEGEKRSSDEIPKALQRNTGGGIGASYAQRGTGMEGFGNTPNQPEKSLGDTILSGISRLAEKVSDSSCEDMKMMSQTQLHGEYRPALTSHGDQNRALLQLPPVKSVPKKHIPGRAGGGWDDDLDIGGQTGAKASSDGRSDGSQNLSDRYESSSSTEDWINEENLVSETTGNTDRFLLTRTDINQFLKACPSVNCEKTVEILNKSLIGHPEHSIMKCLQLIEGLLRCDLVPLEFIGVTCRNNLVTVYKSKNNQIKSKAKKIIRILEKLTSQVDILPLCDISFPSESIVKAVSEEMLLSDLNLNKAEHDGTLADDKERVIHNPDFNTDGWTTVTEDLIPSCISAENDNNTALTISNNINSFLEETNSTLPSNYEPCFEIQENCPTDLPESQAKDSAVPESDSEMQQLTSTCLTELPQL